MLLSLLLRASSAAADLSRAALIQFLLCLGVYVAHKVHLPHIDANTLGCSLGQQHYSQACKNAPWQNSMTARQRLGVSKEVSTHSSTSACIQFATEKVSLFQGKRKEDAVRQI